MPKSHRSTIFHGRPKLPRLHGAQDQPLIEVPRGRQELDRFDLSRVRDDYLDDTRRVGWNARRRERRKLRANGHRGRHPDVVSAIDPRGRLGACYLCRLVLLRHATQPPVTSGSRCRRVPGGRPGSADRRRRAGARVAQRGRGRLVPLAGVSDGEAESSTAGGSGSDPTRVPMAARPERTPSLTTLPSSPTSSHASDATGESGGPPGPAVGPSRRWITNQIAAAPTAATPVTATHRFLSRRRRAGAKAVAIS